MPKAHWNRPRRSVVGLIAILLAVFAAVPSATAHDEHASHIEHFLAVSNDPSTSATILIANGPIHAKGTDTTVSDTQDTFAFPDGTLTVDHHVAKPGKNSFDPVTCLGRYTERGTYEVTGGTGAYENASGHGHYRLRVIAVACDQNADPDYFNIIIKASGPLEL